MCTVSVFADRLQARAGAELLLKFVEFARHRRGGGAGFDLAVTEDQGDAGMRRARHIVQRRQGDRLQGAFHARVLALQIARQLGHPRAQVPSTRLVHHDDILAKLSHPSTSDVATERSRTQIELPPQRFGPRDSYTGATKTVSWWDS